MLVGLVYVYIACMFVVFNLCCYAKNSKYAPINSRELSWVVLREMHFCRWPESRLLSQKKSRGCHGNFALTCINSAHTKCASIAHALITCISFMGSAVTLQAHD